MNTVKHTPTKWFLTMREMKEGDHHAEITLSKDSGFAKDSDEYMRVSGICSLANAKKMVAAPELLKALQSISNTMRDRGVDGCTYGDTEYDSQSVVYGYNIALEQMKEIADRAIKKATE